MLSALVVGAKLVISVVFLWASVAKLADLPGFRRSLDEFGIPGPVAGIAVWLVPVVEMAVGLSLWAPALAWGGALGGSLLLISFTVMIAAQLLQGRRPVCHCFGQLSSRRTGWLDVVRNACLLAVAGFLVWIGPIAVRNATLPWLTDVSPAGQALLAGAALIVLAVGALELPIPRISVGRAGKPAREPAWDPASLGGLPVGEPAPDVQLFDAAGFEVRREALWGRQRPTVLVFLSHDCPTCKAMRPALGRWQRQHEADAALLAIMPWRKDAAGSRLDADDPTIVFQRGRSATKAFRAFVIPCAVRIDAAGRIDSALAIGQAAVEALMAETLEMSRGARAPLAAGGGERVVEAAG